mgnify:FL=1
MKKNMKETKGITLIALVITIIVLLILSGISLSLVLGENGILEKATGASIEYQIAKGREELSLDLIEYQTIKLTKNMTLEEYFLSNERDFKKNDDGTFDVVSENYTFTVREEPVVEIIGYEEVKKDTTPGVLEGAGTETDPLVINSIDDYVAFVKNSRKGETYAGKYIIIARNLDFKDKSAYVEPGTKKYGDLNDNGIKEDLYTELTDETARGLRNAFTFEGVLDGQSHVVRNFYMYDTMDANDHYIGLIQKNKGILKNITVTGKIIAELAEEGYDIEAGALVANNDDNAQIINCRSRIDLTVTGNLNQTVHGLTVYAGGIAGKNDGSATMNKCINSGKIFVDVNIKCDTEVPDLANSYNSVKVGGISGKNDGIMVNVINEGEIYCKKNFTTTVGAPDHELVTGGITGDTRGGTSILNAVNLGKILGASNTSEVNVGGIIGETEGSVADGTNSFLLNAYSAGELYIEPPLEENANTENRPKFGGIVGNGGGRIDSCYSLANQYWPDTMEPEYIYYFGAVIGDYRISSSKVTNCKYRKGKLLGAQKEDEEGIEQVEILEQGTIVSYLNQNVAKNNADSNKLADWLEFVEMAGTIRFR